LSSFYLSVSGVKDLAVCWKNFGVKRCESVKELHFCGELPFEYLCNLQKWKFITNSGKIPDKI